MKINAINNSTSRAFKGSILDNKVVNSVVKKFEPTGANNSFLGLTTLMIGMVIIPRVIMAKRRNPNNKEATKDEIREILARDIQTVAIILFALKSIDSLIGRISSKITGLPLTNKTYKPVFTSDKNLKFAQRIKNAFVNIKDTFHPTGGLIKYSNDEIVSRYSNFNSIEEVQKLFNEIPKEGGNNKKVFTRIIDSLIKDQKALIQSENTRKAGGLNVDLDGANRVLNSLKEAKDKGWECINDENLNQDVKNQLINFFKKPDNSLVMSGKRLSAGLRTLALAIEASYLGFGLPAINQKRLEKKYLSDKENVYNEQFHNAARSLNSSVLVDKTIKPQEIALYRNFMK